MRRLYLLALLSAAFISTSTTAKAEYDIQTGAAANNIIKHGTIIAQHTEFGFEAHAWFWVIYAEKLYGCEHRFDSNTVSVICISPE